MAACGLVITRYLKKKNYNMAPHRVEKILKHLDVVNIRNGQCVGNDVTSLKFTQYWLWFWEPFVIS